MFSIASRPWSILGRLSLLYALLSAALLVSSAVFLYWMLQANMRRQDNATVVEEIHVLRSILRHRPLDPAVLTQEVRGESAPHEATTLFDRVLDRSGHVLIQTQGMRALLPPEGFPTPCATHSPLPRASWRSLPHGRVLRVLAAWAVGQNTRPSHILQVALDVTHDEHVLAAYRATLLGVIITGLIASVGAAVLMAKKVMEPLGRITQSVENISPSQLHARLSTDDLPSELRPLADNFNRMLTRLQDAFARLSQFSADLAHELRTPINNLMGEAEVALARSRPESEYRQVLESSLEECGRLSRMIDSLLFLARAEHGAQPITATTLDAGAELSAVCEFHEAVAEERGVALRADGEGTVYADPLLLRRALNNLVSNALRYTPPGGRIAVSARPANGGVALCVEDNGVGVDRRHIPHLFDRFYRADDARSEHGAGFGLGLSIVHSIVALHSGQVRIESAVGQGTAVWLWLPSAGAPDDALSRHDPT